MSSALIVEVCVAYNTVLLETISPLARGKTSATAILFAVNPPRNHRNRHRGATESRGKVAAVMPR